MVEAAGARPVLALPLPEGLFGEDWAGEAEELLRRAREDCRRTGGGVELCAQLPAGGFLMEPYGELPFAQGVAHYSSAAGFAKKHGADSVLIHRAGSLLQGRAGVLGARTAGLPVYVTMEIAGEGEDLLRGGSILSAFVTLQELGIGAVGFYSAVAGILLEPLEIIAPYPRVPVLAITRDLTGGLAEPETRELFASRARALAARPEILILDDAASALDYRTDAKLRQALRERYEGVTAVIVAQRVSSVMGADKVLVLDEGRVIGCGTHRELLERCGVYRDIYQSQMGDLA